MVIRTITGNINTLAGVDIPNATFSLVPESYVFGSTPTEVVFGEQVTVTADASGDVSFDLHEGKYVGRISTSQGAKPFRLTVDSEGPWTLGRLVGKLDPITSSLAKQIFAAADAAEAAVASLGKVMAISQTDYDALDPPEQGVFYIIVPVGEPSSLGGIFAVPLADLDSGERLPGFLYIGTEAAE